MKNFFQQPSVGSEGGSVLLEYALATVVIMLIWYTIDTTGTWKNSLYLLPTVDTDTSDWLFYDSTVYGALPAPYAAYTAVTGPGTDIFLVLQDGAVLNPALPDGPAAGTPQTAGIGTRTATVVEYHTYGLLGDNLQARVNRTIQGIASPVP